MLHLIVFGMRVLSMMVGIYRVFSVLLILRENLTLLIMLGIVVARIALLRV